MQNAILTLLLHDRPGQRIQTWVENTVWGHLNRHVNLFRGCWLETELVSNCTPGIHSSSTLNGGVALQSYGCTNSFTINAIHFTRALKHGHRHFIIYHTSPIFFLLSINGFLNEFRYQNCTKTISRLRNPPLKASCGIRGTVVDLFVVSRSEEGRTEADINNKVTARTII